MPKCCIDRRLLLCRQAQSHFNLDLFQYRRNMLYWHLGDQTLGDPARVEINPLMQKGMDVEWR